MVIKTIHFNHSHTTAPSSVPVMMLVWALLSSCIASVSAFQPIPSFGLRQGTVLFATNVTPPNTVTPDLFFVTKETTKPNTKDSTPVPTTFNSLSNDDKRIRIAEPNSHEHVRVANKLDANLFKFNKFLIDTVYDIICLIYPVTGSERDYARFFVLETVARYVAKVVCFLGCPFA